MKSEVSGNDYVQDGEPFEDGEREAFWLPIMLAIAAGIIVFAVLGVILILLYWITGGLPFSVKTCVMALLSVSAILGFCVWRLLCY